MSAPEIYLCVRRTLDWHDEAQVEANLIPHFRPKMAAWNATFDMPYHAFRHRLKQIAQSSLDRVEGTRRVAPAAVPDGAIAVPVDDDDWFAPDLAARIAAAWEPEAVGYLWRRATIEVPLPLRRRLWYRLWSFKAPTCNTNDYAIKSFAGAEPILRSHVRAGRYFDEHRERIVRIRATLGVQNRNVSSQTAMGWRRPSITREELVRSCDRHRALYASLALPPDLAWARPYVTEMAELMARLRLK